MEMQCGFQGPIRPGKQRNPGQTQKESGDGSVAAVQRSWNLGARERTLQEICLWKGMKK